MSVYHIGEIQSSGTFEYGLLFSFWGENENFGGCEVIVDYVQQFKGIHIGIHEYFLDLGYPFVHFAFTLAHYAFPFVGPVGSNAFFCNVVHTAGPDLHFYPYTRLAHHCTVQGLITIVFGLFYPIPETVFTIVVFICDCRKYGIALASFGFDIFGSGLEYDSHSIQVENLLESHILGPHLVPDGIWRLDPLADFIVYVHLVQYLTDFLDEIVYLLLLVVGVAVDFGLDFIESLRLLVAQPDVFHFGFYAVESKPVGEGNEDEHSLSENLVPLVFRHIFYGAAIVQTVSQLYQYHTHVIIECEENTLEIFRLNALDLGLVFIVENRLDFGETVNKGGDFVPEEVAYILYSIVGVLHDIVQKRSNNGFAAQTNFIHDYCRDFNRVYDIWFT